MVVIWDGKVVAMGSADEIMQSDNPQVQNFIQGTSPIAQYDASKDLLTDLLGGAYE